MLRKYYKYLIIALAIIASTPFSSAADFVFLSNYTQTLFDSESSMAANEANDVCQTSDGYIWVASYSGLMRYDGQYFKRYTGENDGFTAKSATTLYEDKKKRLWVGTNDSGLFVREGSKFRNISDTTSGRFTTIRSITEDSAGNIYFGSSGGIGKVTDKGLVRIPEKGLDSAFVLDLERGPDNTVWGATRAGEVFVVRGAQVVRRILPNELLGHNVISVLRNSSGKILLGAADGGVIALNFAKYDGKLNPVYYPTPGRNSVNGMYEDKDKRLWICADNGLGYFDSGFVFNKVDGSAVDSSIDRLFQDYEGQYWITSSRQGLLQLSRNKFMNANFAARIPQGVVNAVLPLNNGHLLGINDGLLIGTDDGLYITDKKFNLVDSKLSRSLKSKRIRNIMRDSMERIWISTYTPAGLICVLPDGREQNFTKETGMPDSKTRVTFELSNGDVMAGTNSGAAIIRGGKIVKVLDGSDGLTNLTVLSICEDDDDNIYLGTDGGGIFVIKDGKIKHNYTRRNGLDADIILRMMYDRKLNGIWISTGSGFCFMDSNKKIVPLKITAPISSGIFDIKEGPDGSLMLLADTGIHLASKQEVLGGGKVKWTSYTRRDGLRGTVTANSWSNYDKDGNFNLCCSNGLYSINLKKTAQRSTAPPKLAINRVTVDGQVYENPTKVEIPSTTKRLTLDLAVLSFANPVFNKGEYYLKGFDKEKNIADPKDLSNISYTNLRGGTYTLIFKAYNSDGVANDSPVELTIIKDRTFYEEPVVIALFFLFLSTSVFLITRYYYRRRSIELEQRQQELRTITEQSLAAIADTIDAKDSYTRGHSSRVADYSVAIAKKLGFSQQELDNLYYTALLHDIGKIGIPDYILNKPDKLTAEEYEVMKEHPQKGGNILRNITIIDEIKDGAAYHHERYDGKGYNSGLKGEEIPLIARIIGVADSLDAMASTRTYRTARSLPYIISELKKNAGTQFDPNIAKIMIDLLTSGELNLYKDEQK